MVSWVLVPVALFIGVGIGMFLVALIEANEEDDRNGWR